MDVPADAPPQSGQAALPSRDVVPRAVPGGGRPARIELRRSTSRRVAVVPLVALLLLLAAGAWWLIARPGGGDESARGAAPSRQQTLLVQVAGADGTSAAATALLGVDSGGRRGAILLVPSQLVVDVEGAGAVPFGETLTPSTPRAPAAALSDLLQVNVDGAWILTQGGLAALVDRVGGVEAQVDVDVVTTDAAGRQTSIVSPGSQELNGAQAAAYATYALDGEPELAKLARFNDVLVGVLRRLPDVRAELAVAVAALEGKAQATLPARRLEQTLIDFRRAAVREKVVPDVLPVTEIAVEGQPRAYGLDALRTDELLRAGFGQALQRRKATDPVRVLVQDGTGSVARIEEARTRLVDAGFRFVNGGPAASGSAETIVFVTGSTDRTQAHAKRVAAVLGVAPSRVEKAGGGQTVADVMVILGEDFQPVRT